ncbi:MAG: SLC13 family permease [Pirellulaceae bacterium]|nr:gluconate permease [Planctomycetales bacterium]
MGELPVESILTMAAGATESSAGEPVGLYPLLVLAIGIATVVGAIVLLRVNAFIALITAALIVSFMSPGAVGDKVTRVAGSFGETAGKIGIVIALAAVIGKAMMDSGAADRIVRAFLTTLGEKRSATALAASGFTLAIPVFFDTVFYLLVPLARSMYRRTNKNYVLYLGAIATAATAHALVPPTPGPLAVAGELDVDIGVMILIGIVVGAPAALAGLWFAGWVDRRNPIVMRKLQDEEDVPTPLEDHQLPNLYLSWAPILLPVAMITANTVAETMAKWAGPGSFWETLVPYSQLIGNPNLALLLALAISLLTLQIQRSPTLAQMSRSVEQALMSGGIIVLITAAGGAFGGMLKEAHLADAIKEIFSQDQQASGLGFLWLAFVVSSLIKFAQGSSTAAMLVTAGMMKAMLGDVTTLSFHPVYLATAIGGGSLVGSWMNDSGFWIFSKMGGLTEQETLRTWTPLLVILGTVAMLMTCLLATILPMAPG